MTRLGVAAARRLVGHASALVDSMTSEEWRLPSGCDGWLVQDVIAHLAAGAHVTADPKTSPLTDATGTTEQRMEAMVALRRTWTSDQVRNEYLQYAAPAVAVLAGLQGDEVASATMTLFDLGSYPTHVLADVVAFDHYCHLHEDVLGPRGPVQRTVPPPDDDLLRPVIDWMLLGLPQMQGRQLDVLRVPLALELSGPGGGRWVIAPATDGVDVQVTSSDAACVATVASSATDFVRWATARTPWRDLATVTSDGDGDGVTAFLDRLNII